MGIVLRNVRPGLEDRAPIDLRVDGGVISEISHDHLPISPDDEQIDASGKLCLPGFINAHTHLAMVLFRGLAEDVPLSEWLEKHIWPIEAKLGPEDVYWCSLLGIAESIRGGVVAVADMYFHTDSVARAVEESGIRALLSYGIVAPPSSGKASAELRRAEEVVDRWNKRADGRIRAAVSPHAVYTCSEAVWQESIALAADRDVILHTHLSESRAEVDSWKARTGLTPPAYLEQLGAFDIPMLAAHCVHLDATDMDRLAVGGVAVAACPKSNAKLGSGVAPVRRLLERGIAVGLGTDGAASNNRLDLIEEIRTACLVARAVHEDPMALSARDAANMALAGGRRALGLPDVSFSVGDPADIILIDARNLHSIPRHEAHAMLAFSSAACDVTDVIVNGTTLLRNREFLTIDTERVQSNVERLLRRHRI